MRKILLAIITIFTLTCSIAHANDNFLNAVVLEGIENGGYNILLRSDAIASVRRTVQNNNKITLDIKGLTASDNLSTLYKNSPDTNGIVVENIGNNEVKIHIQGENIAKANIIFDSPASAPVVVADKVSKNTVIWSIVAGIALCVLLAKSRNIKVDTEAKIRDGVRKNLRDREIAMYKNYRRELLTIPHIDHKVTNPRVKRTIRKADTIRHLQRVSRV